MVGIGKSDGMKRVCTISLLLFSLIVTGQELDIGSSRLQWKAAGNDLEKVYLLRKLMQGYTSLGMTDSARFFLHEIESIAEQTGDPAAQIEALQAFGIFWYESFGIDASQKLSNCLRYFGQALELARNHKDVIREAWAHYNLSLSWRFGPFRNMNELDEALKAMSIALEYPSNDSLYVYSCIRTAIAYKWVQKNYEQALRCLDKALVKAVETENPIRLRSVYRELSITYNEVNDRIKAGEYIDKMSRITRSHYRPGWEVSDLYLKGQMLRNENLEDHDFMALLRGTSRVNPANLEMWKRSTVVLEKAYRIMADSNLGFHWSIHNLHAHLFWNYFWLRQPQEIKAMEAMDTALWRAWQNKYEHRVCIFRAAEFYLKGSPTNTLHCLDSIRSKFVNAEFHLLYFMATLQTAPTDSVIRVLQDAYDWYRVYGNPKVTRSILLAMDSLYRFKQDYVTASSYLKEYIRIGDSLETANSEKVLWALQLSNIEKVLQVEREKELKAINRKATLQYIGIVIGIIVVFFILALLGLFHVPKTTIKVMGFFAFLLFFEFIFLLLKKYFTPFTNGEPLKELVVMLVLAGLLIPLHKWMDHRVFHYLTKRRSRATTIPSKGKTESTRNVANGLFVKGKTGAVAESPLSTEKDEVYE